MLAVVVILVVPPALWFEQEEEEDEADRDGGTQGTDVVGKDPMPSLSSSACFCLLRGLDNKDE